MIYIHTSTQVVVIRVLEAVDHRFDFFLGPRRPHHLAQ